MTGSRSVQSDFEEIALLPANQFDHNAHYHDFLLSFLPARVDDALDLGCGTGNFARMLAARAGRVLALDFSPNMISVARRQLAGFDNIDFCETDALRWHWPTDRFDCVVSIATLHHLPLLETLTRIKAALRPGGVLLILDLRRAGTPWEQVLRIIAHPVAIVLSLMHTGRLWPPAEVRRIWRDHGRRDRYLSTAEIRRVCLPLLPGAVIRRHLLWRYSLVWKKPC